MLAICQFPHASPVSVDESLMSPTIRGMHSSNPSVSKQDNVDWIYSLTFLNGLWLNINFIEYFPAMKMSTEFSSSPMSRACPLLEFPFL